MTITINGSTGIAGVDGSAATPAGQGADTNTGVFYGTDIVGIATGGTERVRVNASGQAEFTAGTAALPAITTTGDTNTGIFFPAADTIAFTEGGAEAMRVDSSGRVGIGTTAASSYGRLAVMTPTSTYGFFGIADSVGGGGGVNMAQYYGTAKVSYIDSTVENGTLGAEAARLTFATSTAGTLTERMRINSSGKVGIGTTTPTSTLAVVATGTDTAAEFTGGGTYQGFAIKNNQSSASVYGGTYWDSRNENGVCVANFLADINTDGSSAWSWTLQSAGARTDRRLEHMRLTGDGDLKFNSGYGSTATAYGCRAWVNFNGTGTVAIRSDGNVTNITDNGVGLYTVNFTTAMPDANYACVVSGNQTNFTSVNHCLSVYTETTNPTTSAVPLANQTSAGTFADVTYVNVSIFR